MTAAAPAARGRRPAAAGRPGPARQRRACAPASCAPRLSALGIAIGVAAIVAVLGLSASSQAGLLAEIAQLGTNLLTVQNGQDLHRRHRRAAQRRAGHDRPPARRHQVQDTGTVAAPTSTAAR